MQKSKKSTRADQPAAPKIFDDAPFKSVTGDAGIMGFLDMLRAGFQEEHQKLLVSQSKAEEEMAAYSQERKALEENLAATLAQVDADLQTKEVGTWEGAARGRWIEDVLVVSASSWEWDG